MKNSYGHDYTSHDWLTLHFEVKSNERLIEISELPIFKGDRVLDVGCGPGIFGSYISLLIGNKGHIHCIDHDEKNIIQAQERLSSTKMTNWSVNRDDLMSAIELCKIYDVVILFNVLSYVSNPAKFLKDLSSNMRRGARIIVKDFDMLSIKFNCIDDLKLSSLINASLLCSRDSLSLSCDAFFGRSVPFIYRQHNYACHNEKILTHFISHPFSKSDELYIFETVNILLKQPHSSIDFATKEYFNSAFNLNNGWFYEKDEAFMIENEFVSILTI